MRRFDELAVVEVVGSVAGAFAAKLFADQGARVLRVEPPDGDPLRCDVADPERPSDLHTWLNTSKSSRLLDPSAPQGRATLHELLDRADLVLESAAPGPLEPVTLDYAGAHLVRAWISPFGRSGPRARWRSNEFTDDAIGGHLWLNGEPDREPITRPGQHSAYQAGSYAFIGALAALRARDRDGCGQTVEVSHLEGLASLHQHTTTMWTHAGWVMRREGNAQPGYWHPVGVYRCKDGFVALSLPVDAKLRPFLLAAGLGELLDDARFANDFVRGDHKREFDAALQPWLDRHSAREIIELGQGVFAPVGPVPTPLEVLADEHLAARDFWVALEGEPGLRVPRGPFRVEGREAHPGAPPAPGEGADLPGPVRTAARALEGAPSRPPLEGVRILDLTRVWAGPLAGRILGDLGADVILVEAPWARGPRSIPPEIARAIHLYPGDEPGERPWNRIGGFNKLHRNRRGITLRLNEPRGREIFEALVRRSDVVLENFSPRVMPQLGLDTARLRELNPGLVHVAIPGYGKTGPQRDWVAFGPLIESGSGLSSLMGYADSGPYRSGIAWPDPVSALCAAAATLVALRDRDADPARRGRAAEVAMIEAMVCFVGETLVAAQRSGRVPPRRGNRHPGRAPQGCYPCAGEDRWIAISVTSDAEWAALCACAGLEARLARLDLAGRLAEHDALDAAIARFTRQGEANEQMSRLQERGVLACVVADARDLLADPQLAARDFWVELQHPDAGLHPAPGLPIHLGRTPAVRSRPAPRLGEHNAEVLRDVLGMGEADIAVLLAEGVLVDLPPDDP